MLRRTLQWLVRLSPALARSAWQALPARARDSLAPLVHPIAVGRREGAAPLAVERPRAPARFDVVVASGFDLEPGARAQLLAGGHRVFALGDLTPAELARKESVLDAVLLTPESGRATGSAAQVGWRVAGDPTRLDRSFPEVTVVIPTHRARALCRNCLHSVLRFTGWGRLRIVVADDGSSDGTQQMLQDTAELDPRIEIVRLDRRHGFAAACNAALRRASGQFVVLLNDDTVVSPGWLSRLVGHLERDPELGMIGPVTNQIGNEARIPVSYDSLAGMTEFAARRAADHAGECFAVPTLALFCAALRLDVLRDVGLLDERFEIGMFEDDDLSLSLSRKGLRLAVARDAFVHHVGQATLGKFSDAEYLAIWEANKRRFEQKWRTDWRPPER